MTAPTLGRTIVQLFPELTNVNGDAENALVLARRAAWAGVDVDVYPLGESQALAAVPAPLAVLLGSGVDTALVRTRAALERISSALVDWVAAGVPILAVGTGMELMTDSVLIGSERVEGLGLLPGQCAPLPARVAGELATASPWGSLVGYENHSRGFRSARAGAFGTVLHGIGNGDGTEGVRHGSIYGTHLHGPVLARNPGFADAILAAALGGEQDVSAAARVDSIAASLNAQVLRRLRA